MLIKDYYTIKNVGKQEDGATLFHVSLRADSAVYQGHFPGQPVSPGVCNIQLIKECAEQVVGKPLLMNNLHQCRLTTLVTPLDHREVEVRLFLEEKEPGYKLKATLGKGENVYLDMKAELKTQ